MSRMEQSSRTRPSLAEERREAARSRILDAAREVFSRRGPAATMDEIAEEAGVARRTLFRYFPSKEELAGATLGAFVDATRERVRPHDDESLEEWLTRAVAVAYRVNAAAGPGWLHFVTVQNGGDGELDRIAADLLRRRREMGNECAAEAWRAAGGRRSPPTWLVQIFAVSLSIFSTTAMRAVASLDHDEAARVMARGLLATVTQAVAEQHH
jgi:AcrR family transcriptional regulator